MNEFPKKEIISFIYFSISQLRISLILSGTSLMLLLVSVALASPAPYLADQTYYWIIRFFINSMCALSAAALAFLFRTPKTPTGSAAANSSNHNSKSHPSHPSQH
jgi:hypothetical protein